MENVANPPPSPGLLPISILNQCYLELNHQRGIFLCTAKAVGCCSNTADWRWHWFSFHLGFCQAFSHRFFTWGGRRGAIKCASLCTTSGTLQHSLSMVYRCVVTTFSRLFVYANSQRHKWWFHNKSSWRDSWQRGVFRSEQHVRKRKWLKWSMEEIWRKKVDTVLKRRMYPTFMDCLKGKVAKKRAFPVVGKSVFGSIKRIRPKVPIQKEILGGALGSWLLTGERQRLIRWTQFYVKPPTIPVYSCTVRRVSDAICGCCRTIKWQANGLSKQLFRDMFENAPDVPPDFLSSSSSENLRDRCRGGLSDWQQFGRNKNEMLASEHESDSEIMAAMWF